MLFQMISMLIFISKFLARHRHLQDAVHSGNDRQLWLKKTITHAITKEWLQSAWNDKKGKDRFDLELQIIKSCHCPLVFNILMRATSSNHSHLPRQNWPKFCSLRNFKDSRIQGVTSYYYLQQMWYKPHSLYEISML